MPTLETLKAVLFDIDGTLVDSNDFHVAAWEQAFNESGFQISDEVIRQHIGKGADMLIPALLPDSHEALRKAIAAVHDAVFRSRYLARVKPFPGASELLALLHAQGRKIVLASSAQGKEVKYYVDLLDAAPFLSATTSADEVEHSKPAGDIFAAALQNVSPTSAAEAVVVGDTPYDIEAAAKCSIRAIAVLSGGFLEGELRAAGAVAIYGSVADLRSLWHERH